MHTKVVFRSFLVVASVALLLEAQTGPPVTIVPFSEAGVSFSAYDPATSPALARFVQNHPEVEPLLPYSTILTNSSGKAIRQVTFRWLCADLPGAPLVPCGTVRFGGMFIVQFPVVPGGSRILVTTDHAWREDWADRYPTHPAAAKYNSEHAERIAKRAALSVYVDTVVFEDGLVVGPDRSRTVDYLRARKQAAEAILSAVVPVWQAGGDPTGVLNDLSKEGKVLGGDLGHWYSEIARLLLEAIDQPEPRFRALLDELSRMPDVSNLHRNQ